MVDVPFLFSFLETLFVADDFNFIARVRKQLSDEKGESAGLNSVLVQDHLVLPAVWLLVK